MPPRSSSALKWIDELGYQDEAYNYTYIPVEYTGLAKIILHALHSPYIIKDCKKSFNSVAPNYSCRFRLDSNLNLNIQKLKLAEICTQIQSMSQLRKEF